MQTTVSSESVLFNHDEHLHSQTQPTDYAWPQKILVVGQRASWCHQLASDLQDLDAAVAVVAQPLEAIWQLSGGEIDLVFIEYAYGGKRFLSWLRFLSRSFPHVKRVVVSDVPVPRSLYALLSTRTIHAFLGTPWQVSSLHEILAGRDNLELANAA